MTETQKYKWEKVRAKGHVRFILWSFLCWGVPMWAIQIFGPLLWDTIMQKRYSPPFQIWSPVADFVFVLILWVFGFGYGMGETIWQKRENDYHNNDRTP
jgi:hypothetical protein